MSELADRIAALEDAVRGLGRVEFGDTPGHPFRGNQWTESSDGGTSRDNALGRPAPAHDNLKPESRRDLSGMSNSRVDEEIDRLSGLAESRIGLSKTEGRYLERLENEQDARAKGELIRDPADRAEAERASGPGPEGTKFPDVSVRLSGEDGNAFNILGKVSKALKNAGESEAATAFMDEATSGDYDHLLQTAMKYVNVE